MVASSTCNVIKSNAQQMGNHRPLIASHSPHGNAGNILPGIALYNQLAPPHANPPVKLTRHNERF